MSKQRNENYWDLVAFAFLVLVTFFYLVFLVSTVSAQDTLSQHNTLHKAIQSQAAYYSGGNAISGMQLTRDIDSRFYVIRGAGGDVTIQQHQVYRIDSEFKHPKPLRDIRWQLSETLTDTSASYQITFEGSTGAGSVHIATNCYGQHVDTGQLMNERRSHSAAPDSTGALQWQTAPMYCAGIMTYWLTAPVDGEDQARVGFIDVGQVLSLGN